MAAVESVVDANPISPSAVVQAVLADAIARDELAPSTIEKFTEVLGRFAAFTERGLGRTDIHQIGEAEMRAFVQARCVDGSKPGVSLMHMRRAACRFLFRRGRVLGLCELDPTQGLDLPPRRPVGPRPLTEQEIELCRSHALFHPGDLRHPVALALAEATARTSEIARVLVGEVDAGEGTVHLPGTPRCSARVVTFTAWGLSQVLRRLGHGEARPEDPLLSLQSRQVPRASASMAVIEILRAAGIKAPDVRPVSVVAWRGRSALAAGETIEQVAHLLGIRSLDRTASLIGG